jgi:hypothetical protein
MARRRWKYTEGGKPLPGGPVEVEVEAKPAFSPGVVVRPAMAPVRTETTAPDQPSAWTSFRLPGES